MIDGNSGATRSHGGRWALAGFAALAVMILAGCGSKASPDGDATEASEAQPKSAARAASVDPQHPVVEIDTSRGKIRVRLDAVKAPERSTIFSTT